MTTRANDRETKPSRPHVPRNHACTLSDDVIRICGGHVQFQVSRTTSCPKRISIQSALEPCFHLSQSMNIYSLTPRESGIPSPFLPIYRPVTSVTRTSRCIPQSSPRQKYIFFYVLPFSSSALTNQKKSVKLTKLGKSGSSTIKQGSRDFISLQYHCRGSAQNDP